MNTANTAAHALRSFGMHQSALTLTEIREAPGAREAGFMGRIIVVIVLWSILGGVIGGGIGLMIATFLGPSGTEGLVIQGVSWMISGHLIAGMLAGYLLLADRTGGDLPAVRARSTVLLTVDCANIDETETAAHRLRDLGAMSTEVTAD